MTEIVLMRHGHSLSAREAGVNSDPERPLSPLGEKEVLETARHLGAAGFVPGLIITSPFVRAARTAEIAAGVFPGAPVETNPSLSDGRLQSILDLVRRPGPGASAILVVGHQPLLGASAAVLLGTDAFDLQPAGFVRLRPATEGKSGSLIEFYSPPPGGRSF